MSPEDKLLEGPRLFDRACRLMAAGIRHEHPQLDEAAVKALVIQRLAIADRLDGRELVWREELAPGVD